MIAALLTFTGGSEVLRGTIVGRPSIAVVQSGERIAGRRLGDRFAGARIAAITFGSIRLSRGRRVFVSSAPAVAWSAPHAVTNVEHTRIAVTPQPPSPAATAPPAWPLLYGAAPQRTVCFGTKPAPHGPFVTPPLPSLPNCQPMRWWGGGMPMQ